MSKHYRVADLRPHPELERLLPAQSPDEFDAMKADIAASQIYQPLIIVRATEGYTVIDGRHRLRAAAELGKVEVPCIVLEGLDADGQIERGLRLNNRRNLTSEQKRMLALNLLKKWPAKPDRAIGELVGCDHKTIASVRAEGVERGEIPHVDKRTDSMGREQPAKKQRATGSLATSSKKSKATVNGDAAASNGVVKATSRLPVPEGETPESVARRGLQMESDGVFKDDICRQLNMSVHTYNKLRTIVALADDENLLTVQRAAVRHALDTVNAGGTLGPAYDSIKDIADAKYGTKRRAGGIDRRFNMRLAATEKAVVGITAACDALSRVDIPAGIPAEKREEWIPDIDQAITSLRQFRTRIKEA